MGHWWREFRQHSYERLPGRVWDYWHRGLIAVLALMLPALIILDFTTGESLVLAALAFGVVVPTVAVASVLSWPPVVRKLSVCFGFYGVILLAGTMADRMPIVWTVFLLLALVCLSVYESLYVLVWTLAFFALKDLLLDQLWDHRLLLAWREHGHRSGWYWFGQDAIYILLILGVGLFRWTQYRRQRVALADVVRRSVGIAERASVGSASGTESGRDLYGAMLHSLKTPLTLIRANTELLADDRFSVTTHERQRAAILVACAELDLMIGRGTAAFRTVNEAWGVDSQVLTDLNAYVGQLVENIRPVVPQLRYTSFLPSAQPTAVRVDTQGVKIIVHHLVENADRYSPPNTPIDVVTNQDELFASVKVTNQTVPGQERLTAAVFDPFQRNASLWRDEGGSGLGLYVCALLAHAMVGEITVCQTDNTIDFEVKLPRAANYEPLAALFAQQRHQEGNTG